MKQRRPRLSMTIAAFAVAMVAGFSAAPAVTAPAAALPPCINTQLAPQLGATMINQGVASYADPGSKLARGKDTLVRFFLVNQPAVGSTCAGTTFVKSATLNVTNGSASYSAAALQTFGASGTAIPSSTVSVDSNADPKFVLPAGVVNPCLSSGCANTGAFTPSLTATISYSTSLSSSPVTLALPSPVAPTFDIGSNALRILAVPMGDSTQAYSSQFSDAARVAVENGFAALARIYPLPGGVSSTLNTTTGGIRYKLDLAAMLNLKSISGAYDTNNKFCGTQANFDGGIKGQLAGFLSVYNSSITDLNQRARQGDGRRRQEHQRREHVDVQLRRGNGLDGFPGDVGPRDSRPAGLR
jgi:hypothetical protein